MSKTRLAGQVWNFLKDSAGGSATDIATRLAPDALFGVMAATQTPGDLGDKLIAGAGSALGGGLGGLAAGGAVRHMKGGAGLQNVADLAGSFGGDAVGMIVGDQVTRGKDLLMGGKGQTGFEKLNEQQQQQYAADLENQILAQYGLLPGTREQYADPTTGYGVF